MLSQSDHGRNINWLTQSMSDSANSRWHIDYILSNHGHHRVFFTTFCMKAGIQRPKDNNTFDF